MHQLVEMLESQLVDNLDADTLTTLLKHYPSEDEVRICQVFHKNKCTESGSGRKLCRCVSMSNFTPCFVMFKAD